MFQRVFAALVVAVLSIAVAAPAEAQTLRQTKGDFRDAFRQLEGEDWPTPNDYRNASGAPGRRYWQQKVDYRIDARLNEDARSLSGRAEVVYTNNSPDDLPYLWLLLDQNNYRRDSIAERSRTVSGTTVSIDALRRARRFQEWEGGFTDLKVTGSDGRPLAFTVTDTLMRVELPRPVASGQQTRFTISWSYALPETRVVGGRGGYECFTREGDDGNCLFLGAQWFPRLAVYSDFEGWHNKAFVGGGEFTLEFGDYDVSLTVPSDHVVSATGVLANAEAVLSAEQRRRLAQARTAAEPVYVVTPAEALAAEGRKATSTKTWRFTARNVRDFAFASSRKFVWDAMGVRQDDPENPVVMAMSFYPKEARPLWDAYSTKAIAHTIRVYGEFALPYPYPTAQSINGPVGGMEYPMMTFNGPRPVKDRNGNLTYSERTKFGLIGVIIHEIGHIWFPMTVNSDERQWTWLDEGINTFLQFQAQKRWDPDFPGRGEPKDIVEYMVSRDQVPVMTNSESLLQFGNNGYAKPATALTILRETILGREAFDRAFREYATRWRFKRPTPYDFFRTMEESSGVDLDWFWRGWFYSTEHVDISLDRVVQARVDTRDPAVERAWTKAENAGAPPSLTVERNQAEGVRPVIDTDPATRDWYDGVDEAQPTARERERFEALQRDLTPADRELLRTQDKFYRFTFRNVGGLVMPVIVKMTYDDGSTETVRVPAEVWRYNPGQITWQWVTPKTLVSAELDPRLETADADRSNNHYPRRIDTQTFRTTTDEPGENRMRDDDRTVTPDSLQTAPAARPRPAPDAAATGSPTTPQGGAR